MRIRNSLVIALSSLSLATLIVSRADAGWDIKIQAAATVSSNGTEVPSVSTVWAGVSEFATDNKDALDILAPPAPPQGIRLHLLLGGSGSTALAVERRAPLGVGETKEWALVATNITLKPGSTVTLTWPDLAAVPGDYWLELVDASTDQVVANLRTTGKHEYAAGSSGSTHTFKLRVHRPSACVKGDLDGGGAVDIFDVVKALRCALNLPLTDGDCACADMDCSGEVNIFDVIKVLRRALNLSVSDCP